MERPEERVGGFYDTIVSGLEYESTSASGVTDDRGLFDIMQGETVTFSLGGVTLGSATASAIMTPLDLVGGGDLDSREIINRVQFLLAMDDDALFENGIQISPALRERAADWSVNFDLDFAAFESEVAEELAAASEVNAVAASLPGPEAARMHMEQTFLCVYSGMFTGVSLSTVTGTDGIDEEAVFTVSFLEGGTGIQGFYSDTLGRDMGAISGTSVPVSADRTFVLGNVENGGTFEGAFVSANWIEGTWDNPDEAEQGTFRAARVGHQDDARFRFVGITSEGDDFAIDIDSAGDVTGAVRFSSQPALASATISGQYDTQSHTLTGTVATPDGDIDIEAIVSEDGLPSLDGTFPGGTFFANGCRLR